MSGRAVRPFVVIAWRAHTQTLPEHLCVLNVHRDQFQRATLQLLVLLVRAERSRQLRVFLYVLIVPQGSIALQDRLSV